MNKINNAQIEAETLRQLNAKGQFTLKGVQDAEDTYNVSGTLKSPEGNKMLCVQIPGIMAAMCGVESAVNSSINRALAA